MHTSSKKMYKVKTYFSLVSDQKEEIKSFIFNQGNQKVRMVSFTFHYQKLLFRSAMYFKYKTFMILNMKSNSSRTRAFPSKANTQMRSIF